MTLIWVTLGLLFIGPTDAQFGFNPYYDDANPINPSAYQPSTSFNDPIRRALGIWGRLLNRMSQPNLPTDEELRFHLQPDEESDRQTSRFISPVRGAGIIDERKLNELLPRFREPPTTPETTSTTTTTTTTSTTATTTTSMAKPTTTTTTAVTKKQNPKKSSKKTTTPKPRSTSISSSSSESEESATTHKPSTTSTMKSHGMEPIFDDDVSRIRVRVTSLDQYRNSTTAAATTTTSSPLEKRTDSPKEPTAVEDEDKEHKEGMDEAIQSALADDALIVSTTEAGDTDAPSNVDDAETFEGSGAVEETTASVTEEAISETTEDNASSEAANQDETSQELSAPESGAVESNEPQDLQWEDESDEPKTTLPPPTTTTRKPATTTPKPTKKPTQSSVRRSPFPSKKAAAGRRGSLPEIPEAEEEEQSDVEATTQQVNPTSTIGGLAGLNPQTVYNLNANANSNSSPNVASVITPVNSIIDGIGPLILPLLGYTNRAVAPFVGRRVAGARNYQPSSYQPVQLRTLADGVYQPANNYPSDYESNSILNMAQLATQAVLRGTQNPQSYRSSLLAQQQPQQALRPQAPVVNREAISSLPTGTGRMTGGPRSRFVPEPAMGTKNEQPSVLATFVTPASPAMPEAMLRQEHSGRVRGTDTPYYGPQINYYLGDEINSNRLQQVPRPTHSSPPPLKEAGPDPGYNEGRSNVAGAFFEDSGIMVNSSPATPPQEPDFESFRQTTAGGGFGGGRKPVASYEDVAKMPSYA